MVLPYSTKLNYLDTPSVTTKHFTKKLYCFDNYNEIYSKNIFFHQLQHVFQSKTRH